VRLSDEEIDIPGNEQLTHGSSSVLIHIDEVKCAWGSLRGFPA